MILVRLYRTILCRSFQSLLFIVKFLNQRQPQAL